MSDELKPCPRCLPPSRLAVWTDRDDTWVQCNQCGCRMSQQVWQQGRPLEHMYIKRVVDLEDSLRKQSKELNASPSFHELALRVAVLESRVETLEVAGQKRGQSASNPIPGAWPSIPAPVCAVCAGPHRTGDCAR